MMRPHVLPPDFFFLLISRSDDDEHRTEGRRGSEPRDASGLERDGGRDSYGPYLRTWTRFAFDRRNAGHLVMIYSCVCG